MRKLAAGSDDSGQVTNDASGRQTGRCIVRSAAICRYRHILGGRLLTDPVIGRRLSFGSDSKIGAHLIALMYSVIGTLSLNGIDLLRWLDAWLMACAEHGGRPPDDLAPWLPWSMDDARRRGLTAHR